MKLFGFFRSGTSQRLRIAFNLKGLAYEQMAVDRRTEQHLGDACQALNPQGLVPALQLEHRVLTQSPAIIEWLEAPTRTLRVQVPTSPPSFLVMTTVADRGRAFAPPAP